MPLEVGLQILQHKSLATKRHCISQPCCELVWTKSEALCNSHHRSDNNSVLFQQLKVHSRNRGKGRLGESLAWQPLAAGIRNRDVHLCPADATADNTAQHAANWPLDLHFPGLGHRGIYTHCLRKAISFSYGADYSKKLHLSVSQTCPKTVNLGSQLPQHK